MAAMKDAKISADDVSYVNAHGTSTPIGDAIETTALKRVFGDRAKKVPISSTKSMTGHLARRRRRTRSRHQHARLARSDSAAHNQSRECPDPACDLDYIPNHSRKAEVKYALSNSFGFGGTNASLLFKRWEGQ